MKILGSSRQGLNLQSCYRETLTINVWQNYLLMVGTPMVWLFRLLLSKKYFKIQTWIATSLLLIIGLSVCYKRLIKNQHQTNQNGCKFFYLGPLLKPGWEISNPAHASLTYLVITFLFSQRNLITCSRHRSLQKFEF